MMKKADAPRRIYTRHGIVHICMGGKYFGPANSRTNIDPEYEVVAKPLPRDRVKITQKKPGARAVEESWGIVKVPSIPRSSHPPVSSSLEEESE